jgi:NADPH:quinone reductase-like Zn-dependent oxidoreductase
VLDLVGNSVLRDSLRAVRPGGRVCQAGFLGGLGPVEGFLPVFDMPSGVQLSFYGSFELGTDAFPISAVPLQDIVRRAETGRYQAKPARIFAFEEIPAAHHVMESGEALGKLVVEGLA